jgi:hypothetical protein
MIAGSAAYKQAAAANRRQAFLFYFFNRLPACLIVAADC